MVTRRDFPAFALDRIRELAAAGPDHLQMLGRTQIDADNLGYGLVDVCEVLAALAPRAFDHSESFGAGGKWMDVYHVRDWGSPAGPTDDLYIKLMLHQSCLVVVLNSFHRYR